MDLEKINQEIQSFEARLDLKTFDVITKLNYITLYRHILEAEQMPQEELIARAKKIKPLIRLDKNGHRREFGIFGYDDQLVFIKPSDIQQSYLYGYCDECIVTEENNGKTNPLPVPPLVSITWFTCYHKYGGYYGFFRPGVDEVLSQIPPSVDLNEISAFELTTQSLNFNDIYEPVLDRHVTTVVLYKIPKGLPPEIANQAVICKGAAY